MAAHKQKLKSIAFSSCSSQTRELALAKLLTSGLTEEDACELGFGAVDNAARINNAFEPRPALIIPYLSPLNSRPISTPPGSGDYVRIRYLGKPAAAGFAEQTTKKEVRYAQPPGTGVAAYFPTLMDWSEVLKDPKTAITITEGEFKAASACKLGIPCLGLGGVWSWRSAKLGLPFLPELEEVAWVRRPVFLCFDSDFRTNAKVTDALAALAEALAQRGADPLMVCLPDLPDREKTGLDDFLVERGAEGFDQVIQDGIPLTLARALHQINREIIYVRNPGLVVDRNTLQRIAPGALTAHTYANRLTYEQTFSEEGDLKLKPVKAAKAWLSWPARAESPKMIYCPGEEQEIEEGFNLWRGWGCEPKKGSVKLWKDLLTHIFRGAEPEAVTWFERWCAYPIQNPGAKMFSASVVWSPIQGVGKSLIGYSLGRVYGENFTTIGQSALEGDFTEWAENKQFILGEEVSASAKREHANKLKNLITQKKMRINIKLIPAYEIIDCINYMFASNEPDALFLNDQDRRYFIHEIISPPLPRDWYKTYTDWMLADDGVGPSALFDYLLNLDLGDFDPAAQAFRTKARERMISDNRSDLGSWVAALKSDPAGILQLGGVPIDGDLFNSRELLDLYDLMRRTNATANGVARELRRGGVTMALNGEELRSDDGRMERYYIIRGNWEKATRKKCEEHLRERYNLEG